ncbi:hypothetical protein ACQZ42_32240 [Rhizobium rhizogenes]
MKNGRDIVGIGRKCAANEVLLAKHVDAVGSLPPVRRYRWPVAVMRASALVNANKAFGVFAITTIEILDEIGKDPTGG